jgi:hypothetical protein
VQPLGVVVECGTCHPLDAEKYSDIMVLP